MTRRPRKPQFVEPGHFYSPLGQRAETRAYYASDLFQRQAARVDAMLDLPAMTRLWHRIMKLALTFPFDPAEGFRYFGRNSQFMYYDATILSGMIAHLNPARIVEIGAGFSSAAIFDTIDRMDRPRLQSFTTIDPDLSRVQALDPPPGARLIGAPVQSLAPDTFAELRAGDVFFIDSSHVLKTGSDVWYEYLHLLPALNPGVIVHIHDIFYPFEYPKGWAVAENRSWNEVYLVDMMLTHGSDFEILFFNDAFLRKMPARLRKDGDMFDRFAAAGARDMHAVNGSIWLRRKARTT